MKIKTGPLFPRLASAVILAMLVGEATVASDAGAQADCWTPADVAKPSQWTGTLAKDGHWSTGTIYYNFPKSQGITTDPWKDSEIAVVQDAFNEWQTIIGGSIRFMQVDSVMTPTATLRILWQEPKGGASIWGSVGVDSTFFEESAPPANKKPDMIAFNPFADAGGKPYTKHDHLNWFIDPHPEVISGTVPAGKADLRTVAKHEIGHALGLPHSDGIMAVGSQIKAQGGRVEIGPNNIAAIKALYPLPPCPPVVTAFVAQFVQDEKSTHYTVTAKDPNGGTLSYAWAKVQPSGAACGLFEPTDQASVVWQHADQPLGNCPNELVHKATITVVVSNAAGRSVTCTDNKGSASSILDVKTCVTSK